MQVSHPDHLLLVRNRTLTFRGKTYPCAIGKGGLIAAEEKREGDGCTPVGTWPLRECWWRSDRTALPETSLPLHEITPDDGWCDDPAHPLYNRHFSIVPVKNNAPSPWRGENDLPASFERLWREDHAYDLIVPLGYNDAPVIPGKGSAIFLHCAKENFEGTEGCVALDAEDLRKVLAHADLSTLLRIEP